MGIASVLFVVFKSVEPNTTDSTIPNAITVIT